MECWYVLTTISGKEEEAAGMLRRSVVRSYWSCLAIPKKIKVFRSGGILHLLKDVMFPGYVFVKTAFPGELAEELMRSRALPHFIDCGAFGSCRKRGSMDKMRKSAADMLAPVEAADLAFLKQVCGEELQGVMGVTRIVLDEENRIIHAEGVLAQYIDRIVKLNLHKRFAVVELPLFNRNQPVLFALRLPQDQAG